MELTYIVIILFVVLFYGWYASIIMKRNAVLRALSGIDVQLKKRSNLLPGILKVAKKFMDKEVQLLNDVTAMRSKAHESYDPKHQDSVKKHLEHVGNLDKSLSQLMVNVENYPELKSDQTMIEAQRTFNEVEEQIAASRRFYNSSVTSLNNAIEIFPGSLIANIVGVKSMPFYEVEDSFKSPIDVDTIM